MSTADQPAQLAYHNGAQFSITDPTHSFVVEFLGNATLAGDIVHIKPTAGQTGKSFVIYDTAGVEKFSVAADGTTVVTGTNVVTPVAAISGDGAVTIAAANKTYFITKGTAAAITIVDPTATTHDGVTLTFIATIAAANTLSNAAGSGFFSSGGASKDVATFGGAIGDRISIIAYQGKWYILDSLNITLG